ncbi:MAG TPA: carboxypeptidase regulatory-like domain-containing protein [Gemmatimonadaceae bacterium]|nr:carboxypeptidase regulatory-like domain-containing protein [Gemmatimonadaceae bacterium]
MRSGGTVRLFSVLAILFACGQLGAQKTTATIPAATAKAGTAEIAGVVVDSLNGRFLIGADVMIEGAKATIVTDSLGKFRIGSLPPGTYQVGVFHPLLDTLGLTLATKPFHVGGDSATFIVLAVPSAATIIRRACPVRPRAQGTSAVIGQVHDPETLLPVAGAEVSIAWSQIDISKQTGIRRTPHVVYDSTDATGAFRICGLPNSMQATLQAKRGKSVTAEIPIALGEEESELFARTLLLSRIDSGAKVGNATVSGRVVLEGAPTNAGSRVEVVGTDQVALTNDKGEFTMTKLPSGSQVLLARHLGFGAQTVAVDLTSRQAQRVTIKLPKFVAMIEPVVVNARRAANLDRVGFSQRKVMGQGFYIGPDQLKDQHPNRLTDILRTVPGLRVTSVPEGDVVSSSRGAGLGGDCVQYYVDDMPWQSAEPGDINQFVNASEVVAVEVYQGSTVPAQYSRGTGGCTTIVLWTRFKIRDR